MKIHNVLSLGDLQLRTSDKFGEGHWMASRGSRKHKGIDLITSQGDLITSPCRGIVTKVGWTYADPDKVSCRYVEITSANGYKVRVHYITPEVTVGDKVFTSTIIGECIDLNVWYKGITNHVHLGLWVDGVRVDPTTYWYGLIG